MNFFQNIFKYRELQIMQDQELNQTFVPETFVPETFVPETFANNVIQELNQTFVPVEQTRTLGNLILYTNTGLIINTDTKKIVCMSASDFDKEPTKQTLVDFDTVEYCEDGTVIRLYNHEKKWFTATKKCIDARSSFWSSIKSFDEMFWDIFPFDLLKTLNINYTYVFILIHIDNQIVINHKVSKLIFTECYNNETGNLVQINDVPFETPGKLIVNTNAADISQLLDDYYTPTKRGLVIKKDGKKFKYDFDTFIIKKEIRGNTPFIRDRCLELLQDPDKYISLKTSFPEYSFVYTFVEHELYMLSLNLLTTYFTMFRYHALEQNHPYLRTCKQLHGQYKATRKTITLEDVYNKVFNLQKYVLKTLLNWN